MWFSNHGRLAVRVSVTHLRANQYASNQNDEQNAAGRQRGIVAPRIFSLSNLRAILATGNKPLRDCLDRYVLWDQGVPVPCAIAITC
jgi:hypothetical protein